MNWLTELHKYQRQVEAERQRQRLLRFAIELERVSKQTSRNQRIIDDLKHSCGATDDAR